MVRSWYPKAEEFSASKDGCDVRMGDCRFTGDLHEYRVTGKAEELSADIRLEGHHGAVAPGERASALRAQG